MLRAGALVIVSGFALGATALFFVAAQVSEYLVDQLTEELWS